MDPRLDVRDIDYGIYIYDIDFFLVAGNLNLTAIGYNTSSHKKN